MSVTTTYDICTGLIEAIRAYKPLYYFCKKAFKKQPHIYFEIDENNPPPRSDMPLIAFYQGGVEYDEPGIAARSISVGCAVFDDRKSDADDAVGMYKGYRTAEIFETLVFKAIDSYIDESKMNLSLIDVGSAGVKGYYPHFHSIRELKLITGR